MVGGWCVSENSNLEIDARNHTGGNPLGEIMYDTYP